MRDLSEIIRANDDGADPWPQGDPICTSHLQDARDNLRRAQQTTHPKFRSAIGAIVDSVSTIFQTISTHFRK